MRQGGKRLILIDKEFEIRILFSVPFSNFRHTVRDEDDPRGYGYLRLELRAYVCGARVGEVVVGSGGIATAISSYVGRGLSGAVERERFGQYV